MGPLKGIKIIEIAGIGPVPHAGMMLADMGAEVIRVDRAVGMAGSLAMDREFDILGRGRRSMRVNMKDPEGIEVIYRLMKDAHAVLEGFRPGVMERLGLGPDEVLKRCPQIVYGRMTGWGQEGPIANTVGHDLNYLAVGGVLGAIGPKGGKPVIPLNLVGDFGGGGMLLWGGVLGGIIESMMSGKGQVIDAAMLDGAAILMAANYGMRAQGMWTDERGSNFIDGGSHFYQTYECADGEYISVGSFEPQFYADLMRVCELDPEDPLFKDQFNKDNWPKCTEIIAAKFKTKTREQWTELMEQSNVCFAPILSMEEAPKHPHNVARKVFEERDGWMQPSPAPRFSRTVEEVQCPTPVSGVDTRKILEEHGYDPAEIDALLAKNAVAGSVDEENAAA
ncbi:MAG: CoA transferase [Porticoccaceae bacterium]|nr:CoA transferase [Porticoccaceae bacterium]